MCRSEIDTQKIKLYAYYFECAKIPQRYVLKEYRAECDNHICQTCIDNLTEDIIKHKLSTHVQ